MNDKTLVALMNQDFKSSGDCFGSEEIAKIKWETVSTTKHYHRVQYGLEVVVQFVDGQGSGFVFFTIKDGDLYLGWETTTANTLVKTDHSQYYENLYNMVLMHFLASRMDNVFLNQKVSVMEGDE